MDLLVYAPAGLAQSAAEEFEKLAEKGRHRVEGQLHTARLVGQFAVQTARRQAEQAVQAAFVRVTGVKEASSAPDPDEDDYARPISTDERPTFDGHRVDGGVSPGNGTDPADLAIPGYDSLSASQVVQRLGGLSRDELEEVKGHELAHRHRRTILSRVDQLLTGTSARSGNGTEKS